MKELNKLKIKKFIGKNALGKRRQELAAIFIFMFLFIVDAVILLSSINRYFDEKITITSAMKH